MSIKKLVKGKFYLRLVLTLLLFSIIPVIILAISTYTYSSKLLDDEINDSIFLLQEQVKEKLDTNIKSIQKDLLKYIVGDENIKAFAYRTDEKDFYLTSYLLADLAQLKSNNPYIEDIVVYIKDIDFIMNSEGSMRSDFYFGKYQNKGFSKLLDTTGFWNLAYLDQYRMTGNVFDAIFFCSSVPLDSQNANVFIGVAIDKDKLLKDIENIQYLKAGQSYIIDEKNVPIVSYGKNEQQVWEEIERQTNTLDGKTKVRINGEKWLCISQKSQETNWTYLTLIPYSEIQSRVGRVGWITFYLCAACVLVVFIFSVLFSKKLYIPIGRLYHKISNNEKQDKDQTGNRLDEFFLIDKNIDGMIMQNQSLQTRLLKTVPLIQQSFLKDLLSGLIAEDQIEQKLADYNIVLPHRYFLVLIIYSKTADENIGYVRHALQESFSNHYIVTEGRFTKVLLNYNECNVTEIVSKLCDLPVVISQGVQYDSFSEIVKSYHQAKYAWQYRTLSNDFEYIIINDLIKADFSKFKLSMQFQERYKNCIQFGEFDQAFKIIQDTVTDCLQPQVPLFFLQESYEELSCFAENIAVGLHANLSSVSSHKDKIEGWEKQEYPLEDYKKNILKIYQELLALQKKTYVSKDEEVTRHIMKIIDERYMEDISLEMISDMFHISYSTVSKLFKRKAGEGFVEYLTQKRIESSVELLKDEALSIDEISNRVGYINTPTYIRNFKKVKGVSPGKYRSLQKAEEKNEYREDISDT